MHARRMGIIPLAALTALTVASCGASTASTAGSAAAAAPPAPTSNPPASNTLDACAAFTAQDASAILNQPVDAGKPKTVASDAVSCLYPGKTNIVQTITLTLSSGDLARQLVSTFASQYPGALPLPGIGDAAMRDATGSVLAAVKGNRGCTMVYVGDNPADPNAFAAKLAAVCTRVFTTP